MTATEARNIATNTNENAKLVLDEIIKDIGVEAGKGYFMHELRQKAPIKVLEQLQNLGYKTEIPPYGFGFGHVSWY